MKVYKATITPTVSGGNIEISISANSAIQAQELIKTLPLSKEHEQKNAYSAELKSKIQKRIDILERNIEKSYQHLLDEIITKDMWKVNNEKWHSEKDKLYIRLQEISKIDKQFYEQSNSVLDFANDTYTWFLQGNEEQKRKIVKIVCSNLSYRGKNLDVELKPVFKKLIKNAKTIKNSPSRTKIELLYKEFLSENVAKILCQIEEFKHCA